MAKTETITFVEDGVSKTATNPGKDAYDIIETAYGETVANSIKDIAMQNVDDDSDDDGDSDGDDDDDGDSDGDEKEEENADNDDPGNDIGGESQKNTNKAAGEALYRSVEEVVRNYKILRNSYDAYRHISRLMHPDYEYMTLRPYEKLALKLAQIHLGVKNENRGGGEQIDTTLSAKSPDSRLRPADQKMSVSDNVEEEKRKDGE